MSPISAENEVRLALDRLGYRSDGLDLTLEAIADVREKVQMVEEILEVQLSALENGSGFSDAEIHHILASLSNVDPNDMLHAKKRAIRCALTSVHIRYGGTAVCNMAPSGR